MTLLKFIYNWTKIKEGFQKNQSPTLCTRSRVGSASCFVYSFLVTLLYFGPIINEF